jgi:hypothetical protein
MRSMRNVIVMIALGLAAGCAQMTDTEIEHLEIRTDRVEYAYGDTLLLTFTNVGSRPAGISEIHGCITTLQWKSSEGGWIDIENPSCWIRTAGARLPPGQSFTQRFPITPGYEIGTVYRWRLNVAEESRHMFIGWHSNAFRVVESR